MFLNIPLLFRGCTFYLFNFNLIVPCKHPWTNYSHAPCPLLLTGISLYRPKSGWQRNIIDNASICSNEV